MMPEPGAARLPKSNFSVPAPTVVLPPGGGGGGGSVPAGPAQSDVTALIQKLHHADPADLY